MSLRPLITAAEGFPALERLAANATQELYLSFRIFDPDTALRDEALRAKGLHTWRDLLAQRAENGVKIRVLLADFDPLFTPDLHRLAWRSANAITTHVQGDVEVLCAPHAQNAGWFWQLALRGRIRRALDHLRTTDPATRTPVEQRVLSGARVFRPVTLHQKFAIADGQSCIIGGLDVNERRYDTPDHARPSDETWHDVSMVVDDADFARPLRMHFADTWNAALACSPDHKAQKIHNSSALNNPPVTDTTLIRTRSEPRNGITRIAPKHVITEHESTLIKAFSHARDSIYIETQFLRHRPLTDALVAAAKLAPKLELILLLPPFADRVLFNSDHGMDARHAHALQVKAMQNLRRSFGDRLALIAPARPVRAAKDEPALHGAPPIYVHSKVTLIDDDFGLVGSANLNGRSMRWDTEASVLFRNTKAVQDLRTSLGQKWLGDQVAPQDLRRADIWRKASEANAALPPEARTGFVLPYPLEHVRRFSRLLPILPDDMF